MVNIKIYNNNEIKLIRRSCKLAASSLNYIESFIKEDVTTDELDYLIHQYILKNNAIPACLGYKGFPKSSCISLNDVVCHGIAKDQRLKNGDILNIDVTTILNGYYGDTSRMFKVGNISDEAEKLLRVTKECLCIGIEQVKPNNYFGNIGYEINKYVTSQGFSVVSDYSGHGIGHQFHLPPQIMHIEKIRNIGQKMKPGMVFTIEPMINVGLPDTITDKEDGWTARTIDGKLSAQYEHQILVTPKGYEILTLI